MSREEVDMAFVYEAIKRTKARFPSSTLALDALEADLRKGSHTQSPGMENLPNYPPVPGAKPPA